jgi:hypothetical protein
MGYDGKNYPGTNPSTPFHYPDVKGINLSVILREYYGHRRQY